MHAARGALPHFGFLHSRIVHPYHTLFGSTSKSNTPITFWWLLFENRTPLSQFGFAKKDANSWGPRIMKIRFGIVAFFFRFPIKKILGWDHFPADRGGDHFMRLWNHENTAFHDFCCSPFRIVAPTTLWLPVFQNRAPLSHFGWFHFRIDYPYHVLVAST